MTNKQQTLSNPFQFSGKGLHTGATVNVRVNPAEANYGIKFKRSDIDNAPLIDALAENVVETSRSTVLGKGDAKVSTVEHLMAALWSMGVDNALVEIDGPEVPIIDGSAAVWVDKINEAGITEQNEKREFFTVDKKIELVNEERGSQISIYPDDDFTISVHIDFNSKVVGKQYATVENDSDFESKIAPCRTFVFLHEILPLIEHNLIKGGDIANAIVVVENPLPAEQAKQITKIFDCDSKQAEKAGYIAVNGLRFENEIARHKLLDLIGDLALIGKRIKGHIVAHKPGHSINTDFSKLLRKTFKNNAEKPPFKYDPNQTPVYDINQIKNILPHRPPFLLVDKILSIGSNFVVGVKQVTMNEHFFVGHFPEEPVMPGVLQVEAMAQCGGILALSTVSDPECYSTYFLKIDGVKFKRKVVPGDTLLFHLELTGPIRRGIVTMKAKAFVGEVLACEAELTAMITKNK